MSDYGLVTVAWDSSKIWLVCTVVIEAVFCDLLFCLCDVFIVVIEKYPMLCSFYNLAAMAAMSTANINLLAQEFYI